VDVWEYFETKRREISDASSFLEDGFVFAEQRGSDGKRGRVWGRATINDRAFIQISETVVVQGWGPS